MLYLTFVKDIEHLRTILALFEAHKTEMQISVYLDICAYLKRLHDEAHEDFFDV